MPTLSFDAQISLGDVVTAASVLASAGWFVWVQATSAKKQRQQERRLARIAVLQEILRQLSEARFDLNVALRAPHYDLAHDEIRHPIHAFFELKDYLDSIVPVQLAAAEIIDRPTFGPDRSSLPSTSGPAATINTLVEALALELNDVNQKLRAGVFGTKETGIILEWENVARAENALDELIRELTRFLNAS